MKKIAIAIDSLVGGGAEKVMLTLASTLKEQGHDPHLIVLQNVCQYDVPSNLPVHFCFDAKERSIDQPWKIKRSASRLEKFIRDIEQTTGKFDLYLSNLDKTNLLLSKINLSPMYFIVHSSIEEELNRQLKLGPFAYFRMLRAKKALKDKHLITVSKGIEDEIINAGRIKPASVRTIYNPFQLSRIVAKSKETCVDLPQDDFILHVGRVAKAKRHDILFQAIALMKNQIPLVLLCSNEKKARKIAKRYKVEDRIIIAGFQANPYPWMSKAKALVLSSDYEGLANVLIEALAVGTPVVSSNCNHGPSEILTGELKNFLVPRRNPRALAEKLDELLLNYPSYTNIDILGKVEADQIAQKYIALIDK